MTDVQKPTCHRCGSDHLIQDGVATSGEDCSPTGRQRWECKSCGLRSTAMILPANEASISRRRVGRVYARAAAKAEAGEGRFIITSAQNATPVWMPFFNALKAYAKRRGAQLIVIPYRYKNPTSIWSDAAKTDDWWAAEVVPYLLDVRTNLHKYLQLMADFKMQPTAVNPLDGLESISGPQSAIFGHPKLALKTVPTPQSSMPKIITTTGACTVKNYIPAKAGKKAEFHHTFGACVVELKDGLFHMRHVNAVSDGSFIDLTDEFLPNGTVRPAGRALALVMGDTHQEFVDKTVVSATFGEKGIVETLRPEKLVFHDLHDFYSRNHHHRGDVFVNYAKHNAGLDDVQKALRGTFEWLDLVSPPDVENIIVKSNHPDALARWIKETDPRTDPRNVLFWAETFVEMLKGTTMTDIGASTIDPFAYWGKKWLRCASRTHFLCSGETARVAGIELSYHGHKGSGGAKATTKTYARIGTKTIIGHGHSPEINEGCYRTGTNSLIPLDYAVGAPDAWMHTDCVVYANGKRSLIHVVKGQWRG